MKNIDGQAMPFSIVVVYQLDDLLTEDEVEAFNGGDWPFTFGDCEYSLITPNRLLNAIDGDDEFATLQETLQKLTNENAGNWYLSL